MRGLGAFQMAQMKQRDARVVQLCQHLRDAVDLLEQIASVPHRAPEKPPRQELHPGPPPAPVAAELPPEKLTYTIRQAAAALGVGQTTLYKAIAERRLKAVKLGCRTLIPGDALRAWIAALPQARQQRAKPGEG